MTPHGKDYHPTLLLVPILLMWYVRPSSTIGVTPGDNSQLDVTLFGIENPYGF